MWILSQLSTLKRLLQGLEAAFYVGICAYIQSIEHIFFGSMLYEPKVNQQSTTLVLRSLF